PEPCSQCRARGGKLLGAAADARHVALVIDDHHVAHDADLVAVRARIVERDRRDHARMTRIRNIDDGGAEPVLVRDVTHIGVMSRDGDLTGARHVEVREAADFVRACAGVGHQSSRAPAAFTTAPAGAPAACPPAFHWGISAVMWAANSFGDEPMISTPRSVSALRTAGS